MRTDPVYPELWSRLGLQRHQTWAFAAAGLVAVALAWAFNINTNLLYVVFLLCSYVIVQLLVLRLSLRLGLFVFFLVFLFYSPKEPPAFPEQRSVFVGPFRHKVLPAGTTRSYRFTLAPLRDRQGECGSLQQADIFVQGKYVDGADRAPILSVDHGAISDQEHKPFYGILVLLRGRVVFADGLPGEVRVGLHNPGQKPFATFLGPEVTDARAYPEAVFMKFDTPACNIVVHSSPID